MDITTNATVNHLTAIKQQERSHQGKHFYQKRQLGSFEKLLLISLYQLSDMELPQELQPTFTPNNKFTQRQQSKNYNRQCRAKHPNNRTNYQPPKQ
jgi:hypothetical protein